MKTNKYNYAMKSNAIYYALNDDYKLNMHVQSENSYVCETK